jgi:2-polyprenyl-3-methyl-5-hydroxy-6-metoxy-1,4-benzoquinol methylase
MKQVIKATPVLCKICQSPSQLFGVVDFNKSCLELRGERLPLTGFAVYYHRCSQCGFIFTIAFDEWTPDAFRQIIYNEQYVAVDSDFVERRPTENAKAVGNTLRDFRASVQLLDYGGGTGLFAQRMREEGFRATTYDPFSDVPAPEETVATMAAMLEPKGMILFTTLLQPPDIDLRGLQWWYASPRNGHISLYSAASLVTLFRRHGLRVGSVTEGTHIAYRELPEFADRFAFRPLD